MWWVSHRRRRLSAQGVGASRLDRIAGLVTSRLHIRTLSRGRWPGRRSFRLSDRRRPARRLRSYSSSRCRSGCRVYDSCPRAGVRQTCVQIPLAGSKARELQALNCCGAMTRQGEAHTQPHPRGHLAIPTPRLDCNSTNPPWTTARAYFAADACAWKSRRVVRSWCAQCAGGQSWCAYIFRRMERDAGEMRAFLGSVSSDRSFSCHPRSVGRMFSM